MSVIHLNVLEKNILAILGIDARVSNRQIASTLNVTEGTIRTHIRRLQNEGLIHFTAISDLKLVGSPNLVMLGICADIAQVPALAKTLAAFPDLSCVMVLLGRYNLLAMGLFTSIEAVSELIQSQLRNLPGVRSVETSVSIRHFKYDFRVARIVREKAKGVELDTVADIG